MRMHIAYVVVLYYSMLTVYFSEMEHMYETSITFHYQFYHETEPVGSWPKSAHRTVTSASGERTPKGALDRHLKVCAQDNLCTNESELRDNPLSVRIGHATSRT